MKKALIVFGILVFLMAGGIAFLYMLKLAGDKAKSTGCIVSMKQIGISGQLWAREHNGLLPTNFICMSNELVTPKLLHCGVDRVRQHANTWGVFSEQQSSYVMVTPGARQGATNVVFVRCRLHGHLGLADGEVRRAESQFSSDDVGWGSPK